MKVKPCITAPDVVKLLAQRHIEDVFVPECKNGPTQTGRHLRLDGWAMNKSWANATVWGYEVKVSRSDFLGDDKWRGYLPMCNQFYWVCPQGLIDQGEISTECGLIYVSSNGGRLFTKKKAPHRDVAIPEDVWRYILMCRAKIGAEDGSQREWSRTYWEKWLNDRNSDKDLGYRVSRAIRSRVEDVERVNHRILRKMEEYDDIRRTLAELGWKESDKEWVNAQRVQGRVDELRRLVDPQLIFQLANLAGSLKTTAEALKEATTRS